MNLTTILKELNISKLSAAWTLIFGGWDDLAVLICKAFTGLLRKANGETLKTYAEFSIKVAQLIRFGVDLFCHPEGKYKVAGVNTVDALMALAEHCKDGEYTPAELNEDIDNIEKCAEAWKNLKDEAGE